MSKSKSILITGCSSGMGYAAAKALKELGWRVFATARKADDVARLQAEGFEALQLDLACSESIANAVQEVEARCQGRLDALFNNGAFAIPGALEDISREAMRYELEHGFLGWHELTMRLLPMLRAAQGRIVNNSSVLGIAAMRYRGAYVAMKFAVEGWSDVLRMELADFGVQVVLIEPGPIKTAFRENAYREFQHWVDLEQSDYKGVYQNMMARLLSDKPAPFTLPAEAIVKPLRHALEAKRAKPRYYLTRVTYLMGYLKRLLSTRAFDGFLLRISKREGEYYKK